MSRKRGRGGLVEYGQMARRIVRAYGRAFGVSGDLGDLPYLRDLNDEAHRATKDAVALLRARDPQLSWSQIGDALGVTGEAARQRYGDDSYPNGRIVYALRAAGAEHPAYIGQTQRLSLRVGSYRLPSGGHNPELRHWLATEGSGFEVVVLEKCETQEELDAAELRWIEHYALEGVVLNRLIVGRRGSLPENRRCQETEMRPVSGRRVPPREVRCTLPLGHEEKCRKNGIEFGRDWGKSAWDAYQERSAAS